MKIKRSYFGKYSKKEKKKLKNGKYKCVNLKWKVKKYIVVTCMNISMNYTYRIITECLNL